MHEARTALDAYDAKVAKEASSRDTASISLLIRALLDASERRARDDAWAEAIIRDAVACYAGEDGKWGLREWRCFCRDARLEEPTPAPELIWLTLYDRAATSGGGWALTRVVRAGISEERADAMQVVELVEALSAAHLAARSMTEDIDQFTWRLLAPCAARHRNGGGPGDARKLGACDGRTLDVILESLPALWVLFGAYARDGHNKRAPQDFLDAFPLSVRSCRVLFLSFTYRDVHVDATRLATFAAMASNPTGQGRGEGRLGRGRWRRRLRAGVTTGRRRARRLRAFVDAAALRTPVRRRRALGRLRARPSAGLCKTGASRAFGELAQASAAARRLPVAAPENNRGTAAPGAGRREAAPGADEGDGHEPRLHVFFVSSRAAASTSHRDDAAPREAEGPVVLRVRRSVGESR